MRYHEGVDYFVKEIAFPNQASPSFAISNGDGTFDIYLNTLCCEVKRAEGLKHELRHLEDEHFFRDEDIADIESEASCVRIFGNLASDLIHNPSVWRR